VKSGTLKYSNAGHNYPLLLRAGGSVEQLSGSGMVMGIFPSVYYEVREIKLEPGDLLALYSDGVTEASTAKGVEFGEDGLTQFLSERKSESCSQIVASLADHVRRWRGSSSFSDDFTIVLARRLS
jgi:serine phosphatase RsbU (regulator of sigma subunit)